MPIHPEATGEDIFKVQVSIATSDGEEQILVYNRTRDITVQYSSALPEQAGVVKVFKKLLKKRLKGYFKFDIIPDKRSGVQNGILLGIAEAEEVTDPGW